MFQRYAFLAVFVVMLAGLSAWSARVEMQRGAPREGDVRAHSGLSVSGSHEVSGLGQSADESAELRLELIETLEKLVSDELSYHSVYGHYTKLLARTGVVIPPALALIYEIRITEASSTHFLVSAFSERGGKTTDWATIDENYVLHSSFGLPQPRPASLRFQAQRHLQALLAAQEGRMVSEAGVYRGYFKYDVRRDSENRKFAFAVGIKSPVQGVELEAREGQALTGLDPEKLTELSRYTSVLPVIPVPQRKVASEPKWAGPRLEVEPIDSED